MKTIFYKWAVVAAVALGLCGVHNTAHGQEASPAPAPSLAELQKAEAQVKTDAADTAAQVAMLKAQLETLSAMLASVGKDDERTEALTEKRDEAKQDLAVAQAKLAAMQGRVQALTQVVEKARAEAAKGSAAPPASPAPPSPSATPVAGLAQIPDYGDPQGAVRMLAEANPPVTVAEAEMSEKLASAAALKAKRATAALDRAKALAKTDKDWTASKADALARLQKQADVASGAADVKRIVADLKADALLLEAENAMAGKLWQFNMGHARLDIHGSDPAPRKSASGGGNAEVCFWNGGSWFHGLVSEKDGAYSASYYSVFPLSGGKPGPSYHIETGGKAWGSADDATWQEENAGRNFLASHATGLPWGIHVDARERHGGETWLRLRVDENPRFRVMSDLAIDFAWLLLDKSDCPVALRRCAHMWGEGPGGAVVYGKVQDCNYEECDYVPAKPGEKIEPPEEDAK